MKSVLISTRPKWCEKICHEIGKEESGKPIYEKRIEVRKTAPKEVPFKAYIYETKQKEKSFISKTIDGVKTEVIIRRGGCGKVVGEYICRKVEIVYADNMIEAYYNNCSETRLTDEQLWAYASGKPLKFLYMENVIFYDKPKELGEFYTLCEPNKRTKRCDRCEYAFCTVLGKKPVTRAPQSWCYVEELEEL